MCVWGGGAQIMQCTSVLQPCLLLLHCVMPSHPRTMALSKAVNDFHRLYTKGVGRILAKHCNYSVQDDTGLCEVSASALNKDIPCVERDLRAQGTVNQICRVTV